MPIPPWLQKYQTDRGVPVQTRNGSYYDPRRGVWVDTASGRPQPAGAVGSQFRVGPVPAGENLVTFGPRTTEESAAWYGTPPDPRPMSAWQRFQAQMAQMGGLIPTSMGGTGSDPSRLTFSRDVNVRAGGDLERQVREGGPARYFRIAENEFAAQRAGQVAGSAVEAAVVEAVNPPAGTEPPAGAGPAGPTPDEIIPTVPQGPAWDMGPIGPTGPTVPGGPSWDMGPIVPPGLVPPNIFAGPGPGTGLVPPGWGGNVVEIDPEIRAERRVKRAERGREQLIDFDRSQGWPTVLNARGNQWVPWRPERWHGAGGVVPAGSFTPPANAWENALRQRPPTQRPVGPQPRDWATWDLPGWPPR